MADMFDIFNLQPSVISRDLKGKYLLLYGEPKCGKTSFAVQTPRALVCAFELGVNALAGVRYMPVEKWASFKKIMKQLKDPRAKELYDTVVIDTVSIAYDLCEKYVCQREGVDSVREIPWGQGWKMVSKEFHECMREITMLGFGLVLICHSRQKQTDVKDEEGNPLMSNEPDLSKQAYTVCNAICDIIGYINIEFNPDGTSQRYLYTRKTPTIFAGSRYKYLDAKIPFGYNELVNAIGDAIDKEVMQDGAVAVEHTEAVVPLTSTRPIEEIIEDAKVVWKAYLDAASNDDDKERRLKTLKSLVGQYFGSDSFKVSQATPAQADIVELFTDSVKELL